MQQIRRVMILGQPGSGKSTLGRWLAQHSALPLYHMDHIHWRPHWQERPMDERIAMAQAIEAQEHWIFEGGLAATYASRVARADLVIWLDLPLGLRLWRVTLRALRQHGQTRPDMQAHCPEDLRKLPGFWSFIWRTRHKSRASIARLEGLAGDKWLHLQSPADLRAFQAEVQAGSWRFAPSEPA